MNKILVIAVTIVALALSGYWVRRAFYAPVPADSVRIQELQAEISGLQGKNADAKAEIDKAKESAAKALEKARLAQARAEVFSSQAAEWRGRYETAVRERETLKRAQTGGEAVKELRRMGWVR